MTRSGPLDLLGAIGKKAYGCSCMKLTLSRALGALFYKMKWVAC